MIKNTIPIFIALLVLVIVSIFCFKSSEPTEASVDEDSPLPSVALSQQSQPPGFTGTLSPPSWRPPAPFAKVMAPVPEEPFPRGANFSRRYHQTVNRAVVAKSASKTPVVLAGAPEDGRFHLLPGEIDSHTLAAGRLVFDPIALDQIVAGQTSRLLVPTLTDEVLELEVEQVKTRSADTHTLQGHVVGEDETSLAQIVYHDGIVHGSVARYATNQEIEYRILPDGHMMVRELDHSSITDSCQTCTGHLLADIEDGVFGQDDGGIDQEVSKLAKQIREKSTAGWRTIDVVVGYGQAARQADGGHAQIEARIIASVDRMTLAFANSNIANTEVMLLGTIEDPDYVFPGSSSSNMGDELINLRNESDGGLDAVTDYSNQLGADLTAFVTSSGQGGQSGVANSGNRYTINSRVAMTSSQMVFAHELGHNLGCAHAWGDSGLNTLSNTGWRFKTTSGAQQSTIMAYTQGWGGRVPYYSNPDVLFGGVRTGAVDGYNATGDDTADPRLISGGIRFSGDDPEPIGFDGSTATLGADNANTIDTGEESGNYGASVASNWAVRTSFSVISPAAGEQLEPGYTYTVLFGGGDMDDTADILLYKGGALHATLASGVTPATSSRISWAIPFGFQEGQDYMIRVELNRQGAILIADSGIFSIENNLPHVISQTPEPGIDAIAPISQVSVTFNLPIDTTSFSVVDDIVTFTDPEGANVISAITGVSWSEQNTVATISFADRITAGNYQLVFGPDISDTMGNQMDQDRDEAPGESVEDRYTLGFKLVQVPAYYASMDTDPGWTFDHSSWGYGQPTGANQDGRGAPDPTAGYNGDNVIGYRLDGDAEASIPDTRWATTPAINCTNYTDLTLKFQRWVGADKGFDRAYVEISTDNTNWTSVWANPAGVYLNDSSWTLVEYDISAIADGQSSVYIRWGLGRTDSTWHMCGWNIDEVIVDGVFTPPADSTAPEIFSLTPVNQASGAEVGADLSINFNESVVVGSGFVTLKNLTDNSQQTIDITDSSQVTVLGSQLVINPTADLLNEKTYAVQLSSSAIDDLSGNSFSGISDDITWSFSTESVSFANWIATFNVGGQTGLNDDFDFDNVTNAEENYFGTDPSLSSPGLSSPKATLGAGSTFEFTHPISSNPAPDLTARYLWSTDLTAYYSSDQTHPDGTGVSFSRGVPSNGMVTVTATITGSVPETFFVKIEVTQD